MTMDPYTRKYDKSPPWQDLLHDYTQNSTLHGVRYITNDTRYRLRRFIWCLLIMTSVSIFLYFFISRLTHCLTHPKSVNVEVLYNESLHFPAVTICNQNQFRLTAIQERGLYDVFTAKYSNVDGRGNSTTGESLSKSSGQGCVDQLQRLSEHMRCIPLASLTNITHHYQYSEIAFSGCEQLCKNLHDWKCSRVYFFPLNRTCILTPRVNFNVTTGGDGCLPAVIYRRVRCLGETSFNCDFEEHKVCSLMYDIGDAEDWTEVESSLYPEFSKDHTTDTDKGHIIHLLKSERSQTSAAYLHTVYKRTDGHCLEFFYIMPNADNSGRLRILVRGEDFQEKVILTVKQRAYHWRRKFVKLPKGVYQILIQGIMQGQKIQSVAIDDVTVKPCEAFVTDCLRFKKGDSFIGKKNVTVNNKMCMKWSEIKHTAENSPEFPDESQSSVLNNCRRPYVSEKSLADVNIICYTNEYHHEACSIPFCVCPSHMKACSDGFCLPKSFFCDGVQDCKDGSDEKEFCKSKVSVTCGFDSPFVCGYELLGNPTISAVWIRYIFDGTSMMKVKGNVLEGMRAFMRSPDIQLNSMQCLEVEHHVTDSQGKAELIIFQRFGASASAINLVHTLKSDPKSVTPTVALITLPLMRTTYQIEFAGKVGDPSSTIISIRDIKLKNDPCPGYVPQDLTPAAGGGLGLTCQDETSKCEKKIECGFQDNQCNLIKQGTYDNFGFVIKTAINFTAVESTTPCTETYTLHQGTITSPYYPNSYRNYMECWYVLMSEVGGTITLQFNEFVLEKPTVAGCKQTDYLMVMDADDKILGTFCGSTLPAPMKIESKKVFLFFKTNGDLTYKGFNINYTITDNKTATLNNVLAASMTGDRPFSKAKLSLSTQITYLENETCLHFRYFSRYDSQLMLEHSESTRKILWHCAVDTGQTWNIAKVPLPQKKRFTLTWSTVYGQDDVPSPFWSLSERFTFALADVKTIEGPCNNDSVQASLACDFSSDLCNYNLVPGQPQWERVKRQTGYNTTGHFLSLTPMKIWAKIVSPWVIPKTSDQCLRTNLYFHFNTSISHLARISTRSDTGVTLGLFSFRLTPKTNSGLIRIQFPLPANQGTNYQVIISYAISAEVFGTTDNSMVYMYPIVVSDTACNQSQTAVSGVDLALFTNHKKFGWKKQSQSLLGTSTPSYYYMNTAVTTSPLPVIPTPASNLPTVDPGNGIANSSPGNGSQNSDSGPTKPRVDEKKDEEESETDVLHQITDDSEPFEKIIRQMPETNVTYGEKAFPDMEEFLRETGHQVKDMLYSCTFDAEGCKGSVEAMHTDMGYCLVFNRAGNADLNRTGSRFGLSMTLNIEQYEYIRGPNPDAGIKVYLHNPDDVPLMASLAFAIAPGQHALVDVKLGQSSNLEAPYGNCSRKHLDLYDTSKYTHSRCSMQCNTEHSNKTCQCRMPHMPGYGPVCSLEKYLSCFLDIQYTKRHNQSSCNCPSECKSELYAAAMSYAALSSLSVQRILFQDTEDLATSYRNALNMRHRVNAGHLEDTVKRFQQIKHKQQDFKWMVEAKLTGVLLRIKSALKELTSAIKNDMNQLKNIIGIFVVGFNNRYGPSNNHYDYAIQGQLKSLKFYQYLFELQNGYSAEERTDLGRILQIAGTFNNSYQLLFTKTIQTNNCPVYEEIWGHDEYQHCRNASTKLIQLIASSAQLALNSDWRSMSKLSLELKSVTDLIPNVTDCINAYLKQSNVVLQKIEIAQHNIAKFDNILDEASLNTTKIVEEDMERLVSNSTFLRSIMKNYSKNSIDKHLLTNFINGSSMSATYLLLDSIESKVKVEALGMVHRMIQSLALTAPKWYLDVFTDYIKLTKFFKRKTGLHEVVGGLQIWRTPEAVLIASPILKDKFPAKEKWRYWPNSRSISKFFETDQAKWRITISVGNYLKTLSDELHETEREMMRIKNDVLLKLQEKFNNISYYQDISQLGEDFIKKNFLTVDVYYSAMKYETVTQKPAYTFLNFFSEIGGYLGLLLGCSVLTIFEFLDFMCYNSMTKVEDERHRLKSASPQSQTQTPPPSYDTVRHMNDMSGDRRTMTPHT